MRIVYANNIFLSVLFTHVCNDDWSINTVGSPNKSFSSFFGKFLYYLQSALTNAEMKSLTLLAVLGVLAYLTQVPYFLSPFNSIFLYFSFIFLKLLKWPWLYPNLSLQQAACVLHNMTQYVALMGKHIQTPASFHVLKKETHVSKKTYSCVTKKSTLF